mmetsp:Transcript_29406/g.75007  ORF Transcript_29406/g.75007 Transcript_29406/m.75007 type:complete len:293 (-) Transcript_29406:1217-2095(-)
MLREAAAAATALPPAGAGTCKPSGRTPAMMLYRSSIAPPSRSYAISNSTSAGLNPPPAYAGSSSVRPVQSARSSVPCLPGMWCAFSRSLARSSSSSVSVTTGTLHAAATAGAAPGPASASAIPTAAIPVPQRASAGGSAAAAAPPPVPARIVLLLTDGRVDGYQAREARATASRLCDELPGCVLAAFGVGRGVDRTEMLTIVGGNSPLVGGAEVLPPPPPQHHQQAYQHLYQQPPPPPPHPVHYAQGPVQGVHGVVAAAQAQVAVAAVVPAPAQPPYHPLYLDLYTRDDAPW